MIGNGEEVEELRLYLQSNNLQENIHFIENVNHTELNDYYSVMDIFIFPTQLSESLGLVGLEAMSCGTPVIASDIGGIKTYMKDGYNGYLFPPGNKNILVSKIEKFLNLSVIEKEVMKKNCILTVEKYESNNVAQKLYLKLLSL
ncbi:MAG: glycosyltransferase [Bacteroides sp.]|nr:glycosyltransferase [Bacteroides sp.]